MILETGRRFKNSTQKLKDLSINHSQCARTSNLQMKSLTRSALNKVAHTSSITSLFFFSLIFLVIPLKFVVGDRENML